MAARWWLQAAAARATYVSALTQIRSAQQAAQEENTPQNAPHIMHVGRGGMGNVRSPSRDPLDRKRKEEEEQQLDQLQTAELKQGMHSTGRGGRGNIPLGEQEERGRRQSPGNTRVAGVLRSLSRSRSRDPGDSSRREASRTRGTPLNQVMEDE